MSASVIGPERLVATIRKSSRSEIRISRGQFKGADIANIRVWYLHDESGEFRPSRDGLAFRAELLDEVITALKAAQEVAK